MKRTSKNFYILMWILLGDPFCGFSFFSANLILFVSLLILKIDFVFLCGESLNKILNTRIHQIFRWIAWKFFIYGKSLLRCEHKKNYVWSGFSTVEINFSFEEFETLFLDLNWMRFYSGEIPWTIVIFVL